MTIPLDAALTDPAGPPPVIYGNAVSVAGSPWLTDPEWPAPTPEPDRAPGVYAGVGDDLVLTATIVDGAIVAVVDPAPDFGGSSP